MPEENVHLHLIDLDASAEALSACEDLLSQTESERARRFIRRTDRDRWTVSRAGLRRILAHHCGSTPSEIRFRAGRNGKPALDSVPGAEGVHFNLSHSGPIAAVAVTRLGPIGVDVEYRRAIDDRMEVAARFFSDAEYRALTEIATQQQDDAFLRCWTRKEAVIKATGEGLSAELDSFDVSLEADRPAQVLRYQDDEATPVSWQLRHFEAEAFIGAVAIHHASPIELASEGYWQ